MKDQVILRSIYDDLVKRGKVFTMREFSNVLGYNRTYLSEVLNDTRGRGLGMSNELKKVLSDVLNISHEYMAEGTGNMYNVKGPPSSLTLRRGPTDTITIAPQSVDRLHEDLKIAIELIESQREVIALLKEKLNSLQASGNS